MTAPRTRVTAIQLPLPLAETMYEGDASLAMLRDNMAYALEAIIEVMSLTLVRNGELKLRFAQGRIISDHFGTEGRR